MKNTFKTVMISMFSLSIILFSGCSNENKTLAKNLDNTVTNLIYSATNLDTISNSDIQNFQIKNIDENNLEFDDFENDSQDNSNCCDNWGKCTPTSQYSQYPEEYRIPEKNMKNAKKNFSKNPVSKISQRKNVVISTTNNIENFDNEKTTHTPTVTFSTSTLATKNDELQSLITKLINKRSTLLLYVNDLYKGNISIDSNHRSAINAYLNILKDNTSFFNNQKGIVSNQINQAKEEFSNNISSVLVNAYIIRTNEAISTRIAKLESSIDAIDSILSILKANENTSSKSYIANNYQANNIQKQSDINKNKQTETPQILNEQNTQRSENNQQISPLNQAFKTKNKSNENTNVNLNNNMPYPPNGQPFPPTSGQWNPNFKLDSSWQNNNIQNEKQQQIFENNTQQNKEDSKIKITKETQNISQERNNERFNINCNNEEFNQKNLNKNCFECENNQEIETASKETNHGNEKKNFQTDTKKHDNNLNENLRETQKEIQSKKQTLNKKLHSENNNKNELEISSFIAEKKNTQNNDKNFKT